MTDNLNLTRDVLDLQVDGVALRIAAMHRAGAATPLLFLHGFGSTKEDYADVARDARFAGQRLIAYDAPGCGETECADLSAISIPFLRRTAQSVLAHYGVERFHLVGHSMGGLTALMLAAESGDAVCSFADIEGNIAPEDCFLSRQILEFPEQDPEAFLKAFGERAWASDETSSALFAASLQHKARAAAVGPIFRSMVDLSDNTDLMGTFLALKCPKMFVYGEENSSLSYLGSLPQHGVELAEIEDSGHWPMYANPQALWARLARFVDRAETAT